MLFWGDASRDRGVQTVVDAIPKVQEMIPSTEFWFAIRRFVDSNLTQVLKQLAERGTIKLVGPGREHISGVVTRASVIVLPYESTTIQPPLTLVESMIAGRPLITTPVDGNDELVRDQVTGILVAPGDANGLARAVCTLLSDRSRAEAIASKAREEVTQRYRWDKALQDVCWIYVTVAKREKRDAGRTSREARR